MIRDHRSARVTSILEAWAFHVMRYSRRDQLSMNVAFRSASFSPTAWAVDNRESDLHLWPHTVGRNRDLGSRNPAISLMPAAARVRRMELKEAAWTAQEHAYRAEIERLNAKAEARKPHNRLRRLGEKLLRLPDRRTGSRTPEEAVALPVRVRAPGGAWIHVDPLDRRAQKLIQSDGNLNPPALSAWHLLLQQHAWTHVIDVGANYGEMLVNGGLPSGASIIAVEPNPAIRPYLERGRAAGDHPGRCVVRQGRPGRASRRPKLVRNGSSRQARRQRRLAGADDHARPGPSQLRCRSFDDARAGQAGCRRRRGKHPARCAGHTAKPRRIRGAGRDPARCAGRSRLAGRAFRDLAARHAAGRRAGEAPATAAR